MEERLLTAVGAAGQPDRSFAVVMLLLGLGTLAVSRGKCVVETCLYRGSMKGFRERGNNMPQTHRASSLFDMPQDICHLFRGAEPRADRVIQMLDYGKRDVADATNVPLKSIRWDKKMPHELRDRFIEWAVAINRVASFFQNQEKTILWLRAPNVLLGGLSPREMIRQGRFKKLLKFIDTALAENAR